MRSVFITLLLVSACGDNVAPVVPDDAAPLPVPDAAVQPLTACLDRPTDLARPPTGQLPCELLPPGFGAP